MDEETFYEERDSRTLKLVDTDDYRNKRLLITIDNETAATFNGQSMLFTALNLAGRFCRNIDVLCDQETKVLYPSPKFKVRCLPDVTIGMLNEIDPFGDFNVIEYPGKDHDAVLSIGNSESLPGSPSPITICSDGWFAYIHRGKRNLKKIGAKPNPIGAGAAACLGITEIFKCLIPITSFMENIDDVCFSTLDYSTNGQCFENPPLPERIDLGKVQMVGVGAIGTAILAFLYPLPIEGELELIDFDKVEISNLNRYLIATLNDIGRSKVDMGCDYISHHDTIAVSKFDGKYDEYISEMGRGDADVVLPLVDNNVARHQVQMNMPPLAIYGTTGDWTVTIARHKALDDDCIICRYPNRGEKEGLPCGTVSIVEPSVKGAPINAAVSFVSAFAGVLVAGELLKRSYGKVFTYNYLQVDMKFTPRKKHIQRNPVKDCICQTVWFRRAYETILGNQPDSKISSGEKETGICNY